MTMTTQWIKGISSYTLVNLALFEAKKLANDNQEIPTATFGWGRGKVQREGKRDIDVVYDPEAASNKPESQCLMIGEWPEFAIGYYSAADARVKSQQWAELNQTP